MTRLVGGACIERDVLTIDPKIVEIVVEAGNGPDGRYAVKTPKARPSIEVSTEVAEPRVEAGHWNDRLSHERVDSKIGRLIEGAPAVPTLPDIRPLSHIDQPPHAKLHFLSAASEGEARILTHRALQVGKSLLQINLIDVGPG
jgi:hypothetical protein